MFLACQNCKNMAYKMVSTVCLRHRYNRDVHPDSKVHETNEGATWSRQDPGGPHAGHVDLAICAPLYDVCHCNG